MKLMKLSSMTKGWFVGDFAPTALETASCEVACKAYRAGDREERHLHRVANEVTLVASGAVRINDQLIGAGQIVILDPGEAADLFALEDTLTVVVKVPSVKGDKYSA